jgi:hypothetical protein
VYIILNVYVTDKTTRNVESKLQYYITHNEAAISEFGKHGLFFTYSDIVVIFITHLITR